MASEIDGLKDEAIEQLSLALRDALLVIERGVELMPAKRLCRWGGVRGILEYGGQLLADMGMTGREPEAAP